MGTHAHPAGSGIDAVDDRDDAAVGLAALALDIDAHGLGTEGSRPAAAAPVEDPKAPHGASATACLDRPQQADGSGATGGSRPCAWMPPCRCALRTRGSLVSRLAHGVMRCSLESQSGVSGSCAAHHFELSAVIGVSLAAERSESANVRRAAAVDCQAAGQPAGHSSTSSSSDL